MLHSRVVSIEYWYPGMYPFVDKKKIFMSRNSSGTRKRRSGPEHLLKMREHNPDDDDDDARKKETTPLVDDDDERDHKVKAILVGIFCLFTVSFVPPASKAAMRHTRTRTISPFTLATMQLVWSAVGFLLLCGIISSLRGVADIFGEAAPVGMAFGAKLVLMNVGLAGSSTLAHVALQSTDLFWCAAFAACLIPKEKLTSTQGRIALGGCVLGATLVAASKAPPHVHTTTFAVVANLAAPAFQGFVIVLLRGYVAAAVAKRGHRPVSLVVLEFTTAKLIVSALTAVTLACLDDLRRRQPSSFWILQKPNDIIVVALASLLVACVQLSFSALAVVLPANSIGVVGTVKILPQVLFAAIVNALNARSWTAALADMSRLQLLGTILLLISSFLWILSGETSALFDSSSLRSRRPPSAVDLTVIT